MRPILNKSISAILLILATCMFNISIASSQTNPANHNNTTSYFDKKTRQLYALKAITENMTYREFFRKYEKFIGSFSAKYEVAGEETKEYECGIIYELTIFDTTDCKSGSALAVDSLSANLATPRFCLSDTLLKYYVNIGQSVASKDKGRGMFSSDVGELNFTIELDNCGVKLAGDIKYYRPETDTTSNETVITLNYEFSFSDIRPVLTE